MWQSYRTPGSVEETLRLLAVHGHEAVIIAGGTDLMVELRRKQEPVPLMIDVTRVACFDVGTR